MKETFNDIKEIEENNIQKHNEVTKYEFEYSQSNEEKITDINKNEEEKEKEEDINSISSSEQNKNININKEKKIKIKDNKIVEIFLYTLITLLCFLLSTIFLTSLTNVRSQSKLLKEFINIIKLEKFDSYENSYKGISVLFTFCLLSFIGFIITLFIYVNKQENSHINESVNINQIRINNNEINYNYTERIGIHPSEVINATSEEKESNDKLRKALIGFFIICQSLYFLEIIVLSAYHSKASSLKKDLEKIECDGDYFVRIYRDLIITGYLFLFLFILFDIYILVIIYNIGRSESNIKKEDNNEEDFYCNIFNGCIISCCEGISKAFLRCRREDLKSKEDLNKKKNELDKNLKELEKYLKNLNILNNKIEEGKQLEENEMENLHLPKCDKDEKGDRFNMGCIKNNNNDN